MLLKVVPYVSKLLENFQVRIRVKTGFSSYWLFFRSLSEKFSKFTKNFRQRCQNCILRVQRNILGSSKKIPNVKMFTPNWQITGGLGSFLSGRKKLLEQITLLHLPLVYDAIFLRNDGQIAVFWPPLRLYRGKISEKFRPG